MIIAVGYVPSICLVDVFGLSFFRQKVPLVLTHLVDPPLIKINFLLYLVDLTVVTVRRNH